MGDDSLRVASVVGNNGAEWLSLPTARLIGKVIADQVLILPENSHKALPNIYCITTMMIYIGWLSWHEAKIIVETLVIAASKSAKHTLPRTLPPPHFSFPSSTLHMHCQQSMHVDKQLNMHTPG